ncbi:hypothetical protein [Streptomyces sp. URMC 123]|uniref:hypothetical protein n=1 Tax=Streptomyces sp. URMC 123 TaxID=3423403 RepID=UPI003F19E3F0
MAESAPSTSGMDFPADLLQAQRELHEVRARLQEVCARLPWSVEPLPGFRQTQAEGYWRDVERPDSPGWTDEEQQLVAQLRQRAQELSITVATHPFWATLEGPDRVKARMALKHAHGDHGSERVAAGPPAP